MFRTSSSEVILSVTTTTQNIPNEEPPKPASTTTGTQLRRERSSVITLEDPSDTNLAKKTDHKEKLLEEEAKEYPDYVWPVSAVLLITMLVSVIVILLITTFGG